MTPILNPYTPAIAQAVLPTVSQGLGAPMHAAALDDVDVLQTGEVAPSWLHRGRIPCLDGLRAISIAIVLVEHASLAAGFIPLGTAAHDLLGNLGDIGVDVFFAISGFLITLLLLREHDCSGRIGLKKFYVRRFLRLAPALLVFLSVVLLLRSTERMHLDGWNWLHVLTYTVNFDTHPVWGTAHLWSLSIEEQFYFAWPVALVLLGPRRMRGVVIVWLLLAPVARFVTLEFHPHDMGRFDNWTPFRVDCIAAGCLLAMLANEPTFRRLTRVRQSQAMILIAMAAAVVVVSYVVSFPVSLYQVTVAHTVRALAIVGIIWLSINHHESSWGRLLKCRPMVGIGVSSYSVYLWQQLFFVPHAGNGPGMLLLCLIGTAALATASYVLVEGPFLRLKRTVLQ